MFEKAPGRLLFGRNTFTAHIKSKYQVSRSIEARYLERFKTGSCREGADKHGWQGFNIAAANVSRQVKQRRDNQMAHAVNMLAQLCCLRLSRPYMGAKIHRPCIHIWGLRSTDCTGRRQRALTDPSQQRCRDRDPTATPLLQHDGQTLRL